MAANRKLIAPSNTPGPISGPTFMEDAAQEAEALWRYAQVPLSNIAGTANIITATCDVPLLARTKGNTFLLTPAAANTAAVTLEVDTRGAQALVNRDGAALQAGRLAAGRTELIYDTGTSYQLLLDAPPVAGGMLRSIFTYQTAAGTNGQATPAGWSRYPLNTLVLNDIPGATFDAANQRFTLPARQYEWIDACGYYENYTAGLFLWNTTDNILQAGMSRMSARYISNFRTAGRFSLAAPKTFELRVYASTAVAAGSLGTALNISSPSVIPEQYGFIEIRSPAS